jgi:formate dehydrogenase subunit gamma
MQSTHAVATWDVAAVRQIIDAQKSTPGALLPILHSIQDLVGHIPDDAVPLISDGLNISRAEIHGVITYYHHFHQHPVGKHLVQVCRAEACQARGAEALEAHVKSSLGCDYHQTTRDGAVTLEPAYCLGLCSVGPNIVIGDEYHARVTPEKFDALIAGATQNTTGGAQ